MYKYWYEDNNFDYNESLGYLVGFVGVNFGLVGEEDMEDEVYDMDCDC